MTRDPWPISGLIGPVRARTLCRASPIGPVSSHHVMREACSSEVTDGPRGRPYADEGVTPMKLTYKLCAAGVTLATTAALGLAPVATAAAAAATPRTTASSPINQVLAGVGTFTGSFAPTSFSNQNGQLAVTGVVTGTLTTLAGATTPVTQTVTTTVASATAAGTCKILNLVLGPLHLDVLGLVVDLNQVVLNITAQSGAGNLLGNLLCAVAGLLDGNGINGLANLLNRLLGL